MSLLLILTLFAQNTFFGPTFNPAEPLPPPKPHSVRVEVLVYDDSGQGGVEIREVSFDGQSIPLKPRDINYFRGGGSFQETEGTYRLRWTVNRTKQAWPQNETFTQNVIVDPRDLWIQITIRGSTAQIH